MSQFTKEVGTTAHSALRSTMKGEKWVRDRALPALCSLANAIKLTDDERKKTIAPLKDKVSKAEAPFKESLTTLRSYDTDLRQRLLDEYSSSEGITVSGVGGAAFTERWVFEIPDPNKVDKDYCDAVNEAKIAEAVANGIRNIKGVKIYSERILRITPAK